MGAFRGAATAVLGLAVLETVLSSEGSADRTSGLLSGAASIVDRVLSPTVPAIPNLSGNPALDSTVTVGQASKVKPPVADTPATYYQAQQITTKVAPPAPVVGAPGGPADPGTSSTPDPTPTGQG